MYKITSYTKTAATKIGVKVRPSTQKFKKLDVFKNGKKIASIGDIRYNDYPNLLLLEKAGKIPKGAAAKKQRLYKQRHENFRHKKNTLFL